MKRESSERTIDDQRGAIVLFMNWQLPRVLCFEIKELVFFTSAACWKHAKLLFRIPFSPSFHHIFDTT